MKDVILDTLIDGIKLLPFLFIVFLIMEYIEHKFSKKQKSKIVKSGKYGPFIGSVLGAFPQCGFSVMATNLYATRIITIGTLISIYLSTSDEMLPILISEKAPVSLIIKVLVIKIIVGMVFGFLIDMLFKKKSKKDYEIKDFCLESHCDCEHGIIKSTIKHTLNIILYIVIITFVLNSAIHFLGEKKISKLFLKDTIFSPFIAGLIGLIPNCSSSVILTELYMKGVISFAPLISGLLTGSGVGLLVLFKVNKNLKENLKVLLGLYFIGTMVGIIIEVIYMLI